MADEPEGVDTGPDTGGAMFDDPNREAVGLQPAWEEGTGGESEPKPAGKKTASKDAKKEA